MKFVIEDDIDFVLVSTALKKMYKEMNQGTDDSGRTKCLHDLCQLCYQHKLRAEGRLHTFEAEAKRPKGQKKQHFGKGPHILPMRKPHPWRPGEWI